MEELMKPWKPKPLTVEDVPRPRAKVCDCCLTGMPAGGYLCVECETYHLLLADLERRHREHHEDTKEVREMGYRAQQGT